MARLISCSIAMSGKINYASRQMDLLLKEFIEFCRAYLDDLVAASDTFDDHVYHLTLLLDVLEERGIMLEPRKAYIAFPEVSLLGQRVDALGMTTPQDKDQGNRRTGFSTHPGNLPWHERRITPVCAALRQEVRTTTAPQDRAPTREPHQGSPT
jgi:hypothetical protein